MTTHTTINGVKVWRNGTLVYTAAGLAWLFFWLLWGDFTWAMKDRAVGPSATLLIRMFGVSDLVYTLIIVAFPNFTNIFLCPIISYISDRHRGRWGRRIPFLLFTTPFIVVGLIGLGFTPLLGEWLSRLIGPVFFQKTKCGYAVPPVIDGRGHARKSSVRKHDVGIPVAGNERDVDAVFFIKTL